MSENLNDLLAKLQEKAVHTVDGSYVKIEDVQQIMQARAEVKAEEVAHPKPRTFQQAKQLAKQDEGLAAAFPKRPFPTAVPPTAIEGVKS